MAQVWQLKCVVFVMPDYGILSVGLVFCSLIKIAS